VTVIVPDGPELAGRVAHLGAILFTHVTVASGGALAVAFAAERLAVAREHAVLAASLGFLAWFAGVDVAVLWVVAAIAWWAAVERMPSRGFQVAMVLALLGGIVVAPVAGVGWLAARGGFVREFVAFATNMAVLRAWAYAWDRWHGAPPLSLAAFVQASVFFPTLVNGPVESPHATAAGWRPLDGAAVRAGTARIVRGVAKMALVALALPPAWTRELASLPAMSWPELWGTAVLLWVWFYASFSAWSDVAIGTARLAGHVVPENFDRPWRATDPADFWRRWHVSLGRWLRDYVYVPLGGGRHARTRNVIATFAVSALWHVWGTTKILGLGLYPLAAWTGFLVWGALHAGGVALVPRGAPAAAPSGRGRRGLAAAATFLFAAFCWIPFFAPPSVAPVALLRTLGHLLWPW
jgi:alginate O-acetyltransferase complex protein AlgI